jgi:hypothetical protein
MTTSCAKAPCRSCPYRRDVPSGIWAADEYDKLPGYDGEIIDQLKAKAGGLFYCHQHDGRLCAGWVGTHGPHNLLAFRLHGERLDPALWRYRSPVPLFRSGAAAARHGKRALARPGPAARRHIARLIRKGVE